MSKFTKLAMTAGAIGIVGAAGTFGTFASFTDSATGNAGSVTTGNVTIGGGVSLADVTDLGTGEWLDAGSLTLANAGTETYKFTNFQVNHSGSQALYDALEVEVTAPGYGTQVVPLNQLNGFLNAGFVNQLIGLDGTPGLKRDESYSASFKVRLPRTAAAQDALENKTFSQTFSIAVDEL